MSQSAVTAADISWGADPPATTANVFDVAAVVAEAAAYRDLALAALDLLHISSVNHDRQAEAYHHGLNENRRLRVQLLAKDGVSE